VHRVLSEAFRDVGGAEQAAELSRLRSLLSKVLTDGSISESGGTEAAVRKWWALFLAVKGSFCYIKAYSAKVLHTIGLMLITSVTGIFSWIDWFCTVFRDIVTRVYSDRVFCLTCCSS
jgi:hypothetical protein